MNPNERTEGRGASTFRLCFLMATVLSTILHCSLTASAQDFRIRVGPESGAPVLFQSSLSNYYVLEHSASLDEVLSPVDMELGETGEGRFTNGGAAETGSSFYQVSQVSKDEPRDSDGDGIDDLYELEHRPQLDPLDSSDALEDADGDGLSNRQEYETFEDPDVPTVPGPKLPAGKGFFDFEVLAKTGQLDVRGRSLFDIDRHASVNDNGWVVFLGKVQEPSGDKVIVRPNIYSVEPETRTLRPLLNIAPDFEQPELGTASPSQTFSAPMVNNQDTVYAWRYLSAKVQIGFPFGEITEMPMTYVEAWSPRGNPADGRLDLPLFQVVSGSAGAGSFAHLLFFLNPVTAGTLPTLYNPSSPWVGILGRRAAAFPAVNNSGSVAFGALGSDNGNYVTTTGASSAAAAFKVTGAQPKVRIADDNTVVAGTSENGVKGITFFDYAQPNQLTHLVSTSDGWTDIGLSPNISDDGQIVCFYGELSVAKAAELGITPGPGVFAARRDGVTWKFFRVAGVSANGQLDPGESEFDPAVDSRGDKGPIAAFNLDERSAVNNRGQVLYIATGVDGPRTLFSSRISLDTAENGSLGITGPTKAISIGDDVPAEATSVSDFEIYDALSNNLERSVVCWVAGRDGRKFVLRGTDAFIALSSQDRILKGTVDVNALLLAYPETDVDIEVRNNATGQSFAQRNVTADFDKNPPIIYHSIEEVLSDDAIEAMPAWATQSLVFVTNDDRLNDPGKWDFYALFDQPGEVTVTVTLRAPGKESITKTASLILRPQPSVSKLLDSVDEHLGNPYALPGAPPEKSGFLHRLSTLKTMVVVFATLSIEGKAADYLGRVDGFWAGAKGDYEGVVALLEPIKTITESAKAIAALYRGYMDLKDGELDSIISNLWAQYLDGVDDRVQWLRLSETHNARNRYIEGFMLGFGSEQVLTAFLAAGVGKGIIAVANLAKKARVVQASLDVARKGINAVRFQMARVVPRATITALMIRLFVELEKPVEPGLRAAESIVARAGFITRQTQEKLELLIANYGPDLIGVTRRRVERLKGELGVDISERDVLSLGRFSRSLPDSPTDEALENFLLHAKGDVPGRETENLQSVLAAFEDSPTALLEPHPSDPSRWILKKSKLEFGSDSDYGHGVTHVLRHGANDRGRTVPHGVLDSGPSGMLPAIDEAWERIALQGVQPTPQGLRDKYVVDFFRRLGYEGGVPGAANGSRECRRFLLVVERQSKKVITAYPYR